MVYTGRAITALRAAEHELRTVLREAVAAEAYQDVATVARMADVLANLTRQFGTDLDKLEPAAASSAIKLLGPDWPDSVRATGVEQAATLQRVRGGESSRREQYPRFLRDGDRLVKVAWSKKERRPYEHRAPHEVIQILTSVIQKKRGEGKVFQASDVMPLKNALHEELPSYQSYLALGWLRHVGLISKKGREGYVLKPNAATPERLDQLWTALPVAESSE